MRSWLAIAGALPLVLAWWIYKLAITVHSQAGLLRMLGLFELATLVVLAIAALLVPAALTVARRLPRTVLAGFYGLVLLNVALTGLSIFYLTPRFAPRWFLGLVGALLLVLFIRFLRESQDQQRFIATTLARAGLGLLLLVCLPAPWVITDYLNDQPHLRISPFAPVGEATLPHPPKRIVLVTFDALRARSTSLANPALTTTPNLARLAREATVFSNARAASDNTLVSLPTVLTGVRPNDYFPQIRNNSVYLREGFLTGLGGFLAPAGYTSYYATMLVNPLIFGLDGEFADGHMTSGMFRRNQFNTRAYLPLAASWEWTRQKLIGHWDDEADLLENELPATRKTFQLGLEYLKAEPGRAFLWLHLAVPHTPYYDVPASEVTEPGDPARYHKVEEREVASADPERLKRYEAIYNNYVRFGDAELGRFLAGLRAAGLYEDTLLIVTADHGEEFHLPGHIPHGNGIATEDVTHIPLVIRAPGQQAARRVDGLVGHRDLVPTVLAEVYPRPVPGLPGRSLLRGELPADRYVFTWAMSAKYIPQLKQAQTIAAYHRNFKYLVRYPTREESLYDLATDPEASTNLAVRMPDRLLEIRDQLRRELRP